MGQFEERKIPSILDADFLKGGAGSGNFGHSGRPGERGGSAGGGGGSFNPESFTQSGSGRGDGGVQEMREKIRDSGATIVYDTQQNARYGSGSITRFVVRAPDGQGYEVKEKETMNYQRGAPVEFTVTRLNPGSSGFASGGKHYKIDPEGKLHLVNPKPGQF